MHSVSRNGPEWSIEAFDGSRVVLPLKNGTANASRGGKIAIAENRVVYICDIQSPSTGAMSHWPSDAKPYWIGESLVAVSGSRVTSWQRTEDDNRIAVSIDPLHGEIVELSDEVDRGQLRLATATIDTIVVTNADIHSGKEISVVLCMDVEVGEVRFSSDGSRVAYGEYSDAGLLLVSHDLDQGNVRLCHGQLASRFAFGWSSHNSLAFIARTHVGYELNAFGSVFECPISVQAEREVMLSTLSTSPVIIVSDGHSVFRKALHNSNDWKKLNLEKCEVISSIRLVHT